MGISVDVCDWRGNLKVSITLSSRVHCCMIGLQCLKNNYHGTENLGNRFGDNFTTYYVFFKYSTLYISTLHIHQKQQNGLSNKQFILQSKQKPTTLYAPPVNINTTCSYFQDSLDKCRDVCPF